MDRAETAYRALLRSSQGGFGMLAELLSKLPYDGHDRKPTMGNLSKILSKSINGDNDNTAAAAGPSSGEMVETGEGCLFLDKLPLEMRRKIYFHLVISEKTSAFIRDPNGKLATSVKFGLTPQILRTCKQIYLKLPK